MCLKKYGFSIDEIERIDKYDVRLLRSIAKEIEKFEQIKYIKNKLDIAEAVQFAYVGSKSKKGGQSYKSWQNKLFNKLRRLAEQKIHTIWDSFNPRKSRRF